MIIHNYIIILISFFDLICLVCTMSNRFLMRNIFSAYRCSHLLGTAMSSSRAHNLSVAFAVFLLVVVSAAVGSSDADANAAAEASPPSPPARELTVVERIRADPALNSCTVYPLKSMVADKSINEEFLQCSDVAVPGSVQQSLLTISHSDRLFSLQFAAR